MISETTTSLSVKVGIFVVAALVLMIGLSLRVHDSSLGRDLYPLEAYFETVQGLEPGSDVFLAGVRVGRVARLAFDDERRAVRADLEIRSDFRLPTDSVAVVERSPLLGTSTVVIRFGEGSERLSAGSEIPTRRVPDFTELVAVVSDASEQARAVMDSVKGAADEAREMLAGFNENQARILEKVEGVIDDNRENFLRTSEALAEAGPKLDELATRLNEFARAAEAGEGTLGRLMADEELYDDIKLFTSEMRQIAMDIRSGEGTLSQLIYDGELAQTANDSFARVGDAGAEIQRLIGDRREEIDRALASITEVGPQLEAVVADLREVARKINEGEGTIGKLVNDPSLYLDAQRTVNQVGESFESAEEQGVIRSFLGVIFGALI